MKKIYFLIASLLLLFGLVGCGGPTEVEINPYVEVTFEGYDTLGKIAGYDFDTRKLMADYEKVFENVSRKEVEKLLLEAITFEDAENLKNGEDLNVTWNIDEDDLAEFEEEYKVKLVYSDFTIEVEDLEKLENFDPFEFISVKFEGYEPCVNAYVSNNGNSSTTGYYEFNYLLDKNNNLSNGDKVTVTVNANYSEDFTNFCIKNYGKIPSAQTKEFTVGGCPKYVTDVKEIPAADLAAMDAHIQEVIKNSTADWNYPESYYGATLMGNVFAEKVNTGYYGYVDNRLYFVYKVDVDNVIDGAFSYYYYGNISGLTLDTNGKLEYNLDNISLSRNNFTYGDLYYRGYQNYDELDADIIQPLSGSYDTVVNSVDKEIITKVTHEPNDYSKITDTVNLSADSFTYKWYQGSYYVSGLTESGYAEIMKYDTADYVSILLPAATTDGSVVEGFYSSKAEGGYAFSKLVCDDAPRFELVCPDSYTIFYGFHEDNSFQSRNIFKFKNFVLNAGIKEIKENAFKNCSTLETITLPEGIETIPKQAFAGCTSLKNLVIPATVTMIEEAAFENCTSLIIDTLDIGTLKVGANAFRGVTINTVIMSSENYVPDRYTSWGSIYAPWNGAFVKKLTIADTITKLPAYAFEYMGGVTDVVLPAGITELGERVFAGCPDLKTVAVPEGLTVIGTEAFRDCAALRTINLPAGLTDIKENAFYNCTYLLVDSLDFTTLRVGVNAFYGATLQELVLSADGYVSQRYTSWGTVYAPWNGAVVKQITIKEGVTAVPDYAFEYCEGVTDVILPSTVTIIGTGAFYNSSTLKTVTINEGVESIGEGAFKNCGSLKTVTIPSTVSKIDTEAFHSCGNLLIDKLDISGMTLGNSAFKQATISELVLDSNEFTSSRYSSWGTLYSPWAGAVVKNITITENVTELPAYVFEAITTVDKVVVPTSVTQIKEYAFSRTNFKEIHIPASVTALEGNVFDRFDANTLVIVTPAGSAAETYAAASGIIVKNQ